MLRVRQRNISKVLWKPQQFNCSPLDSLYSFLFNFLAHLLSFDIVFIYSLASKFLNTLNLPSPKYSTDFEQGLWVPGQWVARRLDKAVFAGWVKGCEILYQTLEKLRGDPNCVQLHTHMVASHTDENVGIAMLDMSSWESRCCSRREARPGFSEMTFEI